MYVPSMIALILNIACITNVGTATIRELGSRENILKNMKLEVSMELKEGSTLVSIKIMICYKLLNFLI